MDATTKIQNPFQALADGVSRKHAAVLALAFTNSHGTMDEVWAVIRYARHLGQLPQGDYLQGCYFHDWLDPNTIEPFDMEALREQAWAYADQTVVELACEECCKP